MEHNKQFKFLINRYNTGQLGHAYLLSGPNQIEKEFFAKEFIKFINCSFLKESEKNNNNQEKPCQNCQSCKMIEKGFFPDLLIVKSSKSESSVKNDKDMMGIEIDQVREVQNFLSYKSFYGGIKSVIVNDAERMTFEAQNCFLKNLEEPKGETIIFFISSSPVLLLPTIISRCQEIKFFQSKEYEFSKEEQKILKDLLGVIKSNLATKFQYAKNINLEEGNLNKILEILQRHFRNLLLSKIGVIPNNIEEGKNLTVAQIKNIIKIIDKINNQSNISNINSKLALEILLMEI